NCIGNHHPPPQQKDIIAEGLTGCAASIKRTGNLTDFSSFAVAKWVEKTARDCDSASLPSAGRNCRVERLEHLLGALRALHFQVRLPGHPLSGARFGELLHLHAASLRRLVPVGDDGDAIARALLPPSRDVPVAGE